MGLLLEIRTPPRDHCLCSNLDFSTFHCFSWRKKKNKPEKAGDLPTESHGCRDGGIKQTSGYQETHAQITGFDHSSCLTTISSSS